MTALPPAEDGAGDDQIETATKRFGIYQPDVANSPRRTSGHRDERKKSQSQPSLDHSLRSFNRVHFQRDVRYKPSITE